MMRIWDAIMSVLSVEQGYPSLTVNAPFAETGYKCMKNFPVLVDAICVAYDNPDFKPSEGVTHCNESADYIASRLGCNELKGRLANDIYDYMTASPDKWAATPMEKAQFLANCGSLVFAVQKGDPRGHICVIRPGVDKFSGHFNGMVPSVMNIGKENFIGKGLNYAFQDLPKFFAWRPSL